MAINRFFLSFFCGIFLASLGYARVLDEGSVVESALRFYPKIFMAEQKVRQSEAKQEQAGGAFDAKLSANWQGITSGYYKDRAYFNTKIVKPFPVANLQLYGGYLQSINGDYPDWLAYQNTKSEGRALVGMEASLLRNFLINEQQADMQLAHLDVAIAHYSQQLMEKQVVADARKAFWKFTIAYRIQAVYQDLLDRALARYTFLSKQVAQGDKPAIVLIENNKSILRRRSQLATAKRDSRLAALYLGLFYRDQEGNPISIDTLLRTPCVTPNFDIKMPRVTQDIHIAQERRLDGMILKTLIQKSRVSIDLGKNDFLPDLNLKMEWASDYGTGSFTKDDPSGKMTLQFSVPIENQKGRGKVFKAQSEKSMIEAEYGFLKTMIGNDLFAIANRMQEASILYANATEEVANGITLVKAEKTRFEQGDSDLFLLNMREQDLATTQEYWLKSQLMLKECDIEYRFAAYDTLMR